jgi:hypothetical protein
MTENVNPTSEPSEEAASAEAPEPQEDAEAEAAEANFEPAVPHRHRPESIVGGP